MLQAPPLVAIQTSMDHRDRYLSFISSYLVLLMSHKPLSLRSMLTCDYQRFPHKFVEAASTSTQRNTTADRKNRVTIP